MRNLHSSIRVLAALAVVSAFAACGGGEATPNADSAAAAAAAAAAPPPAPDAYMIVGKDGSWSADISSAGIVYRQKGRDSLMFDYKAPNVTGAISDYEVLMTAKDTVRISISLAMAACTDNAGAAHTHMAQVWLTGRRGGRDVNTQAQGCASKK